MSLFTDVSAKFLEDWSGVVDMEERKRIQNRKAQRKYRRNLKSRAEPSPRSTPSIPNAADTASNSLYCSQVPLLCQNMSESPIDHTDGFTTGPTWNIHPTSISSEDCLSLSFNTSSGHSDTESAVSTTFPTFPDFGTGPGKPGSISVICHDCQQAWATIEDIKAENQRLQSQLLSTCLALQEERKALHKAQNDRESLVKRYHELKISSQRRSAMEIINTNEFHSRQLRSCLEDFERSLDIMQQPDSETVDV